ncbi:diacylglycerol acyltransferase-like protein [Elsinoe australis]|uniref:diacylglycerol O-acyltransferase n=1 Tax=Elsinoe australis TaxID=40998 RepID=A0A4U7BBW0_9PEZI|nr:diacylglycerol acyltransferase-like protein [Elsinoe australis]
MPALNSEPADPEVREAKHLPPKSYADAVEEIPNGYPSPEHSGSDIDEDLIKESPPRSSSDASGARPLGEILDEDEEQQSSPRPGTPTPLTRKPVPGISYADVANPSFPNPPVNGHSRKSSNHSIEIEADRRSTNTDGSPRSPLRRMNRRIPSQTLNGGTREVSDSMSNKLVYEKFDGKTGEHLTSVKPPDEYEEENRTDQTIAEKKEKSEKEEIRGRPKHQRQYSRDDLVSGRQAGQGWGQSAIRFAPLNVPVQRRLQTLMVLAHTLSIAAFLGLFFFMCAIPILWPILIPYWIYLTFSKAPTSGELSFRSERMRRLPIWSLFASYFPARLHRTAELPPTRKYLFGYHPHGIISHGAFAAFATEALGFAQLFPGITNTLLTLEANFRTPLYRDYALSMGLASVSRESCENILSKGGPNGEGMGRAITIVVGGARESLDAQPNSMRLVLKRRKGFVKLAIRTGADLVPVLAFGENELYEQVQSDDHPWIHKGQMWLKERLGFTVPLFHARGVFNYDVGLLPYRRPINIVVGRPIQIQQFAKPDAEYVDEIHERYVNELIGIWNEWKDVFAKNRKEELEIVE